MANYNDIEESNFKLHPFPLLLAVAASALIGWCISLIAAEGSALLAGLTSGIVCAITLGTASCTSGGRLTTVIRTACTTFLLAGIAAGIVLALCCHTLAPYIIVDGLLCIAFGAVVYWLAGSGQ